MVVVCADSIFKDNVVYGLSAILWQRCIINNNKPILVIRLHIPFKVMGRGFKLLENLYAFGLSNKEITSHIPVLRDNSLLIALKVFIFPTLFINIKNNHIKLKVFEVVGYMDIDGLIVGHGVL